MLVEFDTDILLEHEITAHQFLLAKLIYQKRFELLSEYIEVTSNNIEIRNDIDNLTRAGFLTHIEGDYNFNNVDISDDFIKLVTEGNIFEELIALYPTKVVRPDGTHDILKTGLPMCRQIYGRIIQKRRIKHDHIMKCLKYEVEDRTANNTLGYMKRLTKWLSSEGWKLYEEREGDISFSVRSLEEEGYGTEIE